MPGVYAETFRGAMASVCAPVSVVTAMAGDRPHGTTVSAFTSLSLSPPMILVSLDESSELLSHIRCGLIFGLNVLHSDQAALAAGFARKGDDKFSGISWTLERGVPRLDDCAAWLACSVQRMVRGGDHIVVFGHVLSAAHAPAAPLTYYQRRFGTHLAHGGEGEDRGRPRPGPRSLPRGTDATSPCPTFTADSPEELFAFS